MAQDSRPTVPKFASFKAKPAAQRSIARYEEIRPDESSGGHHDRDQSSQGRHVHRTERENERSQRLPSKHRKPARIGISTKASLPPTVAIVGTDESEESPFYAIDRSGDVKNVEYGSLHRYSIPPYRRIGYGRVLGLPTTMRIDREASTAKDVKLQPAIVMSGRGARPLIKKQRLIEPRLVRVSAVESDRSLDLDHDFVALVSSRKRKRGPDLPDACTEVLAFRSIDTKIVHAHDPDDEDLEYASESDDSNHETEETIARQENARLSAATKNSPADIEAWLDLIEHQAKMVNSSASTDFSNIEMRSLAELRISIYEKAVKHFSSQKAERLLLGLLCEGALVWETAKLAEKWDDALTASPSSLKLWTRYLDFMQTSNSFRYEACKAAYIKCLNVLRNGHVAEMDAGLQVEIGNIQTYVLLRMTAFIRDAGYEELAVAIWQAVLELHFFRHEQHAGASRDEVMSAFELFWESEAARIGEEGAQGWRHFIDHGEGPHEVPILGRLMTQTTGRDFRDFADSELLGMDTLGLPARTADEENSDDAFRVVLASDLHDIMEAVYGVISRKAPLDAFLCFLHLPPMQDATRAAHVDAWYADQFLRTNMIEQAIDKVAASLGTGQNHLQNHRATTRSLFTTSFEAYQYVAAEDAGDERKGQMVRFARRVIATIASEYTDDEDLAVYFLAFELHFFAVDASKTAKRLLKQRPSSLKLYNACALVEARLGHVEKASHVWSIAINLSETLSERAREDMILLWHSWIWAELDRGDLKAAVTRFTAVLDDFEPLTATCESHVMSPALKLRVRRRLIEGWDAMASNGRYSHAALYIECLAMLEYLTTDNKPFSTALEITHRYSTIAALNSNSLVELLNQARAELLSLHLKLQCPYKPAVIREELTESIKLFPSNTTFLDMYSANEARFRIDDRVRAVLRDQNLLGARATVITWSWAISEELKRCATAASGSTMNSVRSTFSRALLSSGSTVQSSPALWYTWLAFELHCMGQKGIRPEERRQRQLQARKVFLDGMRYLPWMKRWILNGLASFERTESDWTERELRQVYDVLLEKELRVRDEHLVDR